jgi:hypothetical protein
MIGYRIENCDNKVFITGKSLYEYIVSECKCSSASIHYDFINHGKGDENCDVKRCNIENLDIIMNEQYDFFYIKTYLVTLFIFKVTID